MQTITISLAGGMQPASLVCRPESRREYYTTATRVLIQPTSKRVLPISNWERFLFEHQHLPLVMINAVVWIIRRLPIGFRKF